MNAPGSASTSTASTGTASVAAEQRAHEPSMEEILASIRRIIADDEMLPLTRSATPPPVTIEEPLRVEAAPAIKPPPLRAERFETPHAPPPAPRMDFAPILRASFEPPRLDVNAPLVEPLRALAPTSEAPPTFEAFLTQPAVEMPSPLASRPSALAQAPQADEVLLSPAVGASVSSAFEALTASMFMQNTALVEESLRDMLRPMLRQWLDNNLPTMVERLVRSEIERVARGGRA